MKLYHYTSTLHIGQIIDHGYLSRGDIPLTNSLKYGQEGHAVWFTTCDYANRNDHGLISPICDKSEIRFTADIPPSDPRLFKWLEFARLNKVKQGWYDVLNECGGGYADTWWLFVCPIATSDLKVAQKRNGKYVDIEINEITRHPNEQNTKMSEMGLLLQA